MVEARVWASCRLILNSPQEDTSLRSPSPGLVGHPPRTSSVNPEATLIPSSEDHNTGTSTPSITNAKLRPNIASPTPNEFLLTTGTSYMEPAVGLLVNLEGDPVPQGSLNFSHYPLALCVDGVGLEMSSAQDGPLESQAGYLLALMRKKADQGLIVGLEIQRWDLDPSETTEGKHWLPIPGTEAYSEEEIAADTHLLYSSAGISRAASETEFLLTECVQLLAKRRAIAFTPIGEGGEASATERSRSETLFVHRHAQVIAHMLVWSKSHIWWCTRNPRVLRWESKLQQAVGDTKTFSGRLGDRSLVVEVYNDIRDEVPRDEFDFITLQYIRKKVALLLYFDLARRVVLEEDVEDRDRQTVEESLAQSEVDPRVVNGFPSRDLQRYCSKRRRDLA